MIHNMCKETCHFACQKSSKFYKAFFGDAEKKHVGVV